VIDDVVRQLSFEETKFDGEASFIDVAGVSLTLKNPLWQRLALSMDLPFDNIGVTNLVLDDVLEGEDVDVINADGFDSDLGNDNETNDYRRIRLAELSKEMEGVINASGQ
ncbi:hypothetical protein Tco_0456573, partial [Tanacetum coccineum]